MLLNVYVNQTVAWYQVAVLTVEAKPDDRDAQGNFLMNCSNIWVISGVFCRQVAENFFRLGYHAVIDSNFLTLIAV